MKFKVNPKPKFGDVKLRRCFAYIPQKIHDENLWIWLEFYWKLSCYEPHLFHGNRWNVRKLSTEKPSEAEVTRISKTSIWKGLDT